MHTFDTKKIAEQTLKADIEEGLTPGTEEMEKLILELRELIKSGNLTTPIPCPEPLSALEKSFQECGVDISVLSLSISDIKILWENIEQYINLTDYDLSSTIAKGRRISSPMVPANMQSVMNEKLATACNDKGLPIINHRYFTLENQVQFLKDSSHECFVSCGTRNIEDELSRVKKLLDMGAEGVCIDITHGSSFNVMWLCEQIKESNPDKKVIIGNICHFEDVIKAARAGADAVKIGMGPGSPCTTRVVTGVGEPQLSSIMMCSLAAQYLGLTSIGDGGILDHFLAIAAGSDCNMYGQLFCKTFESYSGRINTDIKVEDGHIYVKYFGEASATAQDRREGARTNGTVPEGDEKWVKVDISLSQLIEKIETQIALGLNALNVTSIKELREHISNNGFGKIIALTDEHSRKVYEHNLKQRSIVNADVLEEINSLNISVPIFNYIGELELSDKFTHLTSQLLSNIELYGPQVGIPIPDVKSAAQKYLETKYKHEESRRLEMKDVCLSPSYADKNRCSRTHTDIRSRITRNIRTTLPYIPANKEWILTKDVLENFVNSGNIPILPVYSDQALGSKVVDSIDSYCIASIDTSDIAEQFIIAKSYLEKTVWGINIEVKDNNLKDAIILCEKIKSLEKSKDIIISGVNNFNDALQAIAAGATGLKVNIEENGATKIASVYAAAKDFDITIIAEADWISTKDANTALALGASCIMESRIAFCSKENSNAEYQGNPPLGTSEIPTEQDIVGKDELMQSYTNASASLKSSLTLQGCLRIEELHEHTARNKTVRQVGVGYAHERDSRVLEN